MYKKITILLTMIFLFSCSSNSVNLNADSECEPKWWDGQGKRFFWQKSYVTNWTKGKVFGTGFERSFDRNTARRAAESLARADIIRQLKTNLEGDFKRVYDENQIRTGVSQEANSIKELEDKLLSKIVGSCSMCFIIKFEDCFEKGMWSAYALAEVDHSRQENNKMINLLESSFNDETIENEKNFEF